MVSLYKYNHFFFILHFFFLMMEASSDSMLLVLTVHCFPLPDTRWWSRTFSKPSGSHSAASLTAGVHQRIQVLPLQQAADTLRPRHWSAVSTTEARKMIHSDSMSTTSPRTWSKLFRMWELKFLLTGDSARHSLLAPHNMFGSAGSDQHPPLHPSQPTHHQMMIG